MYLIIGKGIEHIEENIENKYLASDSTDENYELLKKYREHLGGIKNEIETISSGKRR